MPQITDNFKHIFWFVVGMCSTILGFIICVIFLPIPKENQRNADTAIAYLFGMMSTCAAFLVGSGPSAKKPDAPPGTTTILDATTKTVTLTPTETASP